MPNLSGFLSFVLLTTFTPGPNNIMALTNATRYGFKKAVPFNFGVLLGFVAIVGLASAFSAALYAYIPGIAPFMKAAGCSYILYLAWKTWCAPSGEAAAGESRRGVRSGLLMQFINPKAIFYSLTVTSTFITPYYNSVLALAGFALLLGVLSFSSTCSWSLFGSVFQRALQSHERLANTILAVLLVYCGVSLFL